MVIFCYWEPTLPLTHPTNCLIVKYTGKGSIDRWDLLSPWFTIKAVSWQPRGFTYLYLRRHSPWSGWVSITNEENHGDVSWVVSTPRSPVPASLHLLALQLKLFLHGLRAPLFTHSFFGFNPGDATGTQGIGVWSAEVWWLHYPLLENFVGQKVFNLLPWFQYNLVIIMPPWHCQLTSWIKIDICNDVGLIKKCTLMLLTDSIRERRSKVKWPNPPTNRWRYWWRLLCFLKPFSKPLDLPHMIKQYLLLGPHQSWNLLPCISGT